MAEATSKMFLLYPRVDNRKDVAGQFHEKGQAAVRRCSMLFIDILKDGKLNPDVGDLILARLGDGLG